MAKDIAKSIRLSQEVFGYINEYRGNGFNEKFENIILDYQKQEKEIQKRIEIERKEIMQLIVQARDAVDGVRELRNIKWNVDNCMNLLDGIEADLKTFAENVSQKKAAAPDPEEKNEIQRKKV